MREFLRCLFDLFKYWQKIIWGSASDVTYVGIEAEPDFTGLEYCAPCDSVQWTFKNQTQIRCKRCGQFIRRIDDAQVTVWHSSLWAAFNSSQEHPWHLIKR